MKCSVALPSVEAQEEPLPARPSLVRYRHVPREGEAGPQKSGSRRGRGSGSDQGAPTAAPPDQGQAEINVQIDPQPSLLPPHKGSQALAPLIASTFKTLAKDRAFQI